MKILFLLVTLILSNKVWSVTVPKNLLTADIQFYLEHMGYRTGEKAGFIGPITHRAIRQYQSDHNLEVNGKVDNDLLQHLRKTYFQGRKAPINEDMSYPLRGKLVIRVSQEHIRDCRIALESLAEAARESARHTANLAKIESTHEYNPYLHEYLVIPPEVDKPMRNLHERLDNLDYKLWKASRFCEKLYQQPTTPKSSLSRTP